MRNLRRIRNEDGAVAVEFALSAVAMITMLVGCFQAFLMLYSYHYVSYAARDATRWALVRGSECASDSTTMPNCNAQQSDILTHLQDLNFPGINTSNLSVTASWYSSNNTTPVVWTLCSTGTPGTGCNNPGGLVQVQVTYAYPLAIPFMTSKTVNMSSTSQLVISQ